MKTFVKITAVAVLALGLVSCEEKADSMEEKDNTVYYTVSFETDGGSAVESQRVEDGAKAEKPAAPKKKATSTETYTFDGWYSDSSFKTPFDFDTPITQDTKLYAKWKVTAFNLSGLAEWAGVRHSSYGNFVENRHHDYETADPSKMTSYVNDMSGFYKKDASTNATGALVWIVGEVSTGKSSCRLNFPKPDGVEIPDGLGFAKSDSNEDYLKAFDDAGFDVWLQVEAGFVDIEKLAVVVMTKYKKHSCVKGFGIDAEWYQNTTDGNDGTPVDDATAKKVDEAIKKINSTYSVFVKHWDTAFLPQTYRGQNNDMIFVTDSQYFDSLNDMKEHYSAWAEHYEPNPVFFQIGYYAREEDDNGDEIIPGSDEKIWKSFNKPLKDFGTEILKSLKVSEQKRGIIWVDMTFLDAYERSK